MKRTRPVGTPPKELVEVIEPKTGAPSWQLRAPGRKKANAKPRGIAVNPTKHRRKSGASRAPRGYRKDASDLLFAIAHAQARKAVAIMEQHEIITFDGVPTEERDQARDALVFAAAVVKSPHLPVLTRLKGAHTVLTFTKGTVQKVDATVSTAESLIEGALALAEKKKRPPSNGSSD